MYKSSLRAQSAFSLVELSVVIAIIGLIAGGVMVGANLLAGAHLRAGYKQVEGYRAAVYAFKIKYNKLPGDFNNALAFFPTCPNPPGGPCNGNGNGTIDWNNSDRRERYRAFNHMSLAGFIDEPIYTGPVGAGYVFDGRDCPIASIGHKACFELRDKTIHLAGGSQLNDHVLSVEDAFMIDSKYDDAIANTGKIRAGWGFSGSPAVCTNSPGAGANAVWRMHTGDQIVCLMDFLF